MIKALKIIKPCAKNMICSLKILNLSTMIFNVIDARILKYGIKRGTVSLQKNTNAMRRRAFVHISLQQVMAWYIAPS